MPADILGTNVLKRDEFVFPRSVFANLLLADEIQRPPRPGRRCSRRCRSGPSPGRRQPPPGRSWSWTQNPIEREGTYRCRSWLGRFLFKAIVAFRPPTTSSRSSGGPLPATASHSGPRREPSCGWPASSGSSRQQLSPPLRRHPRRGHPPQTPSPRWSRHASATAPAATQAPVLGKARHMEGRPNPTEDIWAPRPDIFRHRPSSATTPSPTACTDIVEAVVTAHPGRWNPPAAGVRCRPVMLLDPRLRAQLERLALGVGEESRPSGPAATTPPASASLDFADYRPLPAGRRLPPTTTTSAPAWGS